MRLLSFWANARRSISTSSRFSLLITTQRATPVPSSILITSTLHLLLSSIALAPVPALAPAPTLPCSLTTNQTHPILFLPVPDVLWEGQRIVVSETEVKPQRMIPSNNRNAAVVKKLGIKEAPVRSPSTLFEIGRHGYMFV